MGSISQPANQPSGKIEHFAMSTAPSGWVKANGAAVSRSAYAALFAAIGTVYGAGDGSTTFNVPDLRGEFMRGFDDGRGVDSGRVIGSYQGEDFKSHSHTTSAGQNFAEATVRIGWNGANASTGTPSTNATGGSETRPRNIAMLACIKY